MTAARQYTTEIASGLLLTKFEQDEEATQDYQVLDQTNTYVIDSKLESLVALTVDITGSEGVAFVGPVD